MGKSRTEYEGIDFLFSDKVSAHFNCLVSTRARESCRGEMGCALYERFWVDGSIADGKQQKILKEAHRKEGWNKNETGLSSEEWELQLLERHQKISHKQN